jgi:hypothetical protein
MRVKTKNYFSFFGMLVLSTNITLEKISNQIANLNYTKLPDIVLDFIDTIIQTKQNQTTIQ